jgi:hypothetical protein
MGSSSKTPVEKLRDKAWVEANGHTASIMDYARFNYVAQPEDHIGQAGLFPRIGDYDKWAIKWGYTYTGLGDEADKKINNKWVVDALKKSDRVWFGGEGYNADPRAQSEDLSDNAVKASEYGIKNLKVIIKQLPEWTKEEGDHYDNLNDMYGQLTTQFNRYMGHVVKNIGGVNETFKSIEEVGDVYTPTPLTMQKAAMQFLQTQLFATPNWLLDNNILNKISNPIAFERIQTIQTNILRSLLDKSRLYRLNASNTRYGSTSYALHDMMEDTRKGIFAELTSHLATDVYRRNLQKAYVAQLGEIIHPEANANMAAQIGRIGLPSVDVENTDVVSEAKAQLKKLAASIQANKASFTDANSSNHFDDLQDRIKHILDPK